MSRPLTKRRMSVGHLSSRPALLLMCGWLGALSLAGCFGQSPKVDVHKLVCEKDSQCPKDHRCETKFNPGICCAIGDLSCGGDAGTSSDGSVKSGDGPSDGLARDQDVGDTPRIGSSAETRDAIDSEGLSPTADAGGSADTFIANDSQLWDGLAPPDSRVNPDGAHLDTSTSKADTGAVVPGPDGGPDARADVRVDLRLDLASPDLPGVDLASPDLPRIDLPADTRLVVESPKIVSFTAEPSIISRGSQATLTAVFTGGTGSVSGGVGVIESGVGAPTGALSSDKTFTLTVTNSQGEMVTLDASVKVVPLPTITSFVANPLHVISGNATTLTSVFADGTGTIDHGVGEVTSTIGVSVIPTAATTVYSLTVSNQAGDKETKTATVTLEGFIPTGSMSVGRRDHTATLLNNQKVLIAGGNTSSTGASLATAEIYDPGTGKFTATTGSMTVGRQLHTATLMIDGRVLLVGGMSDPDTVVDSAEIYDPTTNRFTAVSAAMSSARAGHAATRLKDGRVYFVGGYSTSDSFTSELSTVESFNPSTEAFNTGLGMLVPRPYGPTVTLLNDDRILVVGGANVAVADNPGAEIASGTIPMFSAVDYDLRTFATATLMPGGQVLVTGGGAMRVGQVATAALFDPNSKTFTDTTGNMTTARMFHTATPLSESKVLIVGGRNASGVRADADIYEAGSFTNVSSLMSTVRFHHTATRLSNGWVLVTGGGTDTSNTSPASASADLYIE